MILPEEELERIKKILQRAVDKAAGKLDLADLLTEDNPDGCEFSFSSKTKTNTKTKDNPDGCKFSFSSKTKTNPKT